MQALKGALDARHQRKELNPCYRNMELNALNHLKPGPVPKPLAVVNDATFVLRTAA